MSLECQLGREAGMFEETPERAARLLIDSPVLSESKFRKLIALGNDDANFAHHVIDINYAPSQYRLEGAIQHTCDEAVAAVRAGQVIDRKSVVEGKSVSVRGEYGGRRDIKKKKRE